MKKKLTVAVLIFLVLVLTPTFGVFFMKSLGKSPNKVARENYLTRASNFDGKKFHNEDDFEMEVTKEKIDPNWVSTKKSKPVDKIPVVPFDLKSVKKEAKDKVLVTWLGHSSVFMQMNGQNLLFDPIFSKMISPVSFVGAKRFADLPFDENYKDEFPEIDILFLSHDHYDHLDYKTIKNLDSKIKRYVVPLGVESHLKYWGVSQEKITNYAWWEENTFDGLKITSVPAQHFSGRKLIDSNKTLWCGWVLQDEFHKIFVSGDSGYNTHFSRIGEKFGGFDFAFMECGQYGMGWKKIHSFPEESAQAILDLKAASVMPMHWGAVDLSYNGWDDSIERFIKAINPSIPYATPLIGQTFDIDILKTDSISEVQKQWWKEIQ